MCIDSCICRVKLIVVSTRSAIVRTGFLYTIYSNASWSNLLNVTLYLIFFRFSGFAHLRDRVWFGPLLPPPFLKLLCASSNGQFGGPVWVTAWAVQGLHTYASNIWPKYVKSHSLYLWNILHFPVIETAVFLHRYFQAKYTLKWKDEVLKANCMTGLKNMYWCNPYAFVLGWPGTTVEVHLLHLSRRHVIVY